MFYINTLSLNVKNKLLAKRRELICLKEASFSATAASVGLWALPKVRSKPKDRL
jgi:hypothetical protein